MTDSYYDRQPVLDENGKPRFAQQSDDEAQENMRQLIEQRWRCKVQSYGHWAPVDFWAGRGGEIILAGIEFKRRYHELGKYPTVFLNLRKWIALHFAQLGLDKPAIYVVQFDDGVRWIELCDIPVTQVRIGGCREFVKSVNDIEPVIEVPIALMEEFKL